MERAAAAHAQGALTLRVAELEGLLMGAGDEAVDGQARGGMVPQSKAVALQQMLRAQQRELHDSYRFSAGTKLLVAVSRHTAVGLAAALGTWRRACDAMAMEQQLTAVAQAVDQAVRDSRAASLKRNERMGERVAELADELLLHERRKTEHEVELAAATEKAAALSRRVAHLEASSEGATVGGGQLGGAPPAKVQQMQQMLQAQQRELHDGYRFSAGCKLMMALGRRTLPSLAAALSTWQCTVHLLRSEHACKALETDNRRRAKEARAFALLLEERDVQIRAMQVREISSGSSDRRSSQAPRRAVTRPPLPLSAISALTPSASMEELGGALASASARSMSPKRTLSEQVEHALGVRAQRQARS